jgi:signal peptidase I
MRKRTIILLGVLLIFGIGVTVFRVFFVKMAGVPAGAMANTIIPGDRVLLTKSFGQIERGRVVVFHYDPQYAEREHHRNDTQYRIARVVGLPGETIQMRGRTVFINGKPLSEQKVTIRELNPEEPLQELSTEGSGPYRVFYSGRSSDESAFSDLVPFAGQTPFQIPKDNYFLMGDNRDNSEDSRYRGPVPRNLIWGNVSVVYYSVDMKTDETRWDRFFKKVQ